MSRLSLSTLVDPSLQYLSTGTLKYHYRRKKKNGSRSLIKYLYQKKSKIIAKSMHPIAIVIVIILICNSSSVHKESDT